MFIDRWGTLLLPPPEGFAREPGQLVFVDGVTEALFRASRAGWRLYLLGNEDSVWTGKLEPEAWERVEASLLERLSGAGISIARNYACLDHPEGIPGHQKDSVYLLPNTGAFYHAHHTDGVELKRSWVIGDSTLELVAGWRSGCRLAGVRTGQGLADGGFHVDPAVVCRDLPELVGTLLALEGAIPAR